jgi:hypothetical protein
MFNEEIKRQHGFVNAITTIEKPCMSNLYPLDKGRKIQRWSLT